MDDTDNDPDFKVSGSDAVSDDDDDEDDLDDVRPVVMDDFCEQILEECVIAAEDGKFGCSKCEYTNK